MTEPRHPLWNGTPILLGDTVTFTYGAGEPVVDTIYEIRWHPKGVCWMHPTNSRSRVLYVEDLLSVNGKERVA